MQKMVKLIQLHLAASLGQRCGSGGTRVAKVNELAAAEHKGAGEEAADVCGGLLADNYRCTAIPGRESQEFEWV